MSKDTFALPKALNIKYFSTLSPHEGTSCVAKLSIHKKKLCLKKAGCGTVQGLIGRVGWNIFKEGDMRRGIAWNVGGGEVNALCKLWGFSRTNIKHENCCCFNSFIAVLIS